MNRVKFNPEGVPMLRADVADVLYYSMRVGGTCIATCAEDREPHLPSSCGRVSDDEHCSKFRSSAALNGTSCAGEQMGGTARMIHEHFCSNRGFAAATSLPAGGLAAQSVNMLFQVCLPPSRLRAPVSRGVWAVSSRTLVVMWARSIWQFPLELNGLLLRCRKQEA